MDFEYINPDRVILRTDLVPRSVIENFYRYVEISLVNGCWNWTGSMFTITFMELHTNRSI